MPKAHVRLLFAQFFSFKISSERGIKMVCLILRGFITLGKSGDLLFYFNYFNPVWSAYT